VTEKELAKEKAKAEKAAKFAAKQAKLKEAAPQKAGSEPKPAAEKKQKEAAPTLPPYQNDTPPGEKKTIRPFDDPYFSAYHPKAVESAWYEWWEKSGFFKPEAVSQSPVGRGKNFVIPLPPPNVTGALHCGHALANSLQDTLIRWHRMR
jgi:valyl-tRNA synthetase